MHTKNKIILKMRKLNKMNMTTTIILKKQNANTINEMNKNNNKHTLKNRNTQQKNRCTSKSTNYSNKKAKIKINNKQKCIRNA